MSRTKLLSVIALSALLAATMPISTARSEETVEKAGVAVGLSAGNLWFVPLKVISASMGALSGALSFVFTGNRDLTRQIWRDTLEGPYLITPEIAGKSIGERPELLQND